MASSGGILFPGSRPRVLNEKIGEQISVFDFNVVGNGVHDDLPGFQAAWNAAQNKPGCELLFPGGYNYAFLSGAWSLAGSTQVTVKGDGTSSKIIRGANVPNGQGLIDIYASNVRFENFCVEGSVVIPQKLQYNSGFSTGRSTNDPMANSLTQNTSFWLHAGANNITFDRVTIQHTGGYAILADARLGDIFDLDILDCWFLNNRPHLFGTNPADLNYGSWTGGVLLHGDGQLTTGMVRNFLMRNSHFRRCTGNGVWSHLYGFSSLHENVKVLGCDAVDQGLDFIEMGGVFGCTVSDNVGRRVGYICLDDTSQSTPKYLGGAYATGIDSSGLVIAATYADNSLTSCNGGYINLDGFESGTVEGNTLKTPLPSEPMYVEDQISNSNWGGRASTGGISAETGIQSSNSSENAGGSDVTVTNNTIINISGGGILAFAGRAWKISENNINHPSSPYFAPIILGNIGASGILQCQDCNVSHNKIVYVTTVGDFATGSLGAIYEYANGFAFSGNSPNWVHDNELTAGSGNAVDFIAATGSNALTKTVFPTNQAGITAASNHFFQRTGSVLTSAFQASYQEGNNEWVHFQLSAYWTGTPSPSGTLNQNRGPFLNISENAAGGVIGTGPRVTSVFADAVVTGKLYADSLLALTNTTYADSDANLLNQVTTGGSSGTATVALLRYKGATGYIEQSIAITGGVRSWVPLIPSSGSAAGGDTDVQYNKAGAFGGDSGLQWMYAASPAYLSINQSTSPALAPQSGTGLQLTGATGTAIRIELDTYGINPVIAFRRYNGTSTSPTALLAGQAIAALNGQGYDGSATSGAVASIQYVAYNNWSTSDHSTYITFSNIPSGGTILGERARLSQSGVWQVGSTADDGSGGIIQATGYMSASAGYYSVSTSYEAVKVTGGGALLNSVSLVNYIGLGATHISSLAPTSGDNWDTGGTPTGVICFDASSGTQYFYFSYGTGASTLAQAFIYAQGLYLSGTANNSLQVPNGGITAAELIATDSVFWLAEVQPALSDTNQARVYFDSTTFELMISANHAAYVPFAVGNYWQRVSTTLEPVNAGDNIATSGLINSTATGASLCFQGGGGSFQVDGYGDVSGGGFMHMTGVNTSGSTYHYLEGGYVGIGFSGAPTYPLDIKYPGVATAFRVYGQAGSGSDNVQIRFAGQKDGELWAIGCDIAAGGATKDFEFYNLLVGLQAKITTGGVFCAGGIDDGSGLLLQSSSGASITGIVQATGTGSGSGHIAYQTYDGSGHYYTQIDFAGNATFAGVIESNGSSGGVNVTANTATNSIQTVGGVYGQLGLISDNAVYLKNQSSAPPAPGSGYGYWAWDTGSTFRYWNGSADVTVNLGSVTNYWTLSGSALYNNSGTSVSVGTSSVTGGVLNVHAGTNENFQVYGKQSLSSGVYLQSCPDSQSGYEALQIEASVFVFGGISHGILVVGATAQDGSNAYLQSASGASITGIVQAVGAASTAIAFQTTTGGVSPTTNFQVDFDGNLSIASQINNLGSYKTGGTTIVDSSRNATFASLVVSGGNFTVTSGGAVSTVSLVVTGGNFQVDSSGDISAAGVLNMNGTGSGIEVTASSGAATYFNSIKSVHGGMYAISFTALSYTNLGTSSGAPTATTNDTFNGGAMYWDTSTHTLNVHDDSTHWYQIIGSTGGFVGNGVAVGNNGIGGSSFGWWNGSAYAYAPNSDVTYTSITSIEVAGGIVRSISGVSDARLKLTSLADGMGPFTYGLAAVRLLDPTYWIWNAEGEKIHGKLPRQIGFTAQNVIAAMPEAQVDLAGGYLGYAHMAVTGALVNGQKELDSKLEAALARIAVLESRLAVIN